MTKAWQTLTHSGAQETIYPDNPRKDVRELFVFEPKRVLDIGCAAGAVSKSLKEDYPEVFAWGCELNPEAASIAATYLDRVTQKPLEEWSTEELALLGTMDTVLLLDVLEHMYNPWQTLQILAQHLPTSAQVIVSLPNVGNVDVMHDLAAGFWHYKPAGVLDVSHIRFFTAYEMHRLFYETGYKMHVQTYPYLLQSVQQLPESFPAWFETEFVKVLVQNQEHWHSLNAYQIYFRLSVAQDGELNAQELAFRHAAHLPTKTM